MIADYIGPEAAAPARTHKRRLSLGTVRPRPLLMRGRMRCLMNWNWRHLVGLGLFLALFCAALIANVSDSSMSHVRGAWLTQSMRYKCRARPSAQEHGAWPNVAPEREARPCRCTKRSALADSV